MLIDWFTVGAQVLNFLILVGLLKHFLYKPILDAIDARERRIAAELADAAGKQAAADKERDEFRDKNQAFEHERGALLGKAAEEAKTERERLVAEAHAEADALRVKQDNAMRGDQVTLGREMTRLAAGEVFAIARRALADLAAASLEERMGEVFTRRLREMDGKAKESLAAALKSAGEPAVLRSTFVMSAKDRATIQNALNETFLAEIRVRFETAPGGVCGIELTASGEKLAWGIAEYLSALEQKVESLLDASATATATATAITTTTAIPTAAP
jgi:F-type H+-transporting ATPase subunit b